MTDDRGDQRRVHRCSRCGTEASAPVDGMPPAWSLADERGRASLLCERCTRAHVRDIEGKLDEAWWS